MYSLFPEDGKLMAQWRNDKGWTPHPGLPSEGKEQSVRLRE